MNHLLTKSNYLSYLQCPKKLWLEKYAPEKAKAASLAQQYFIEEGKRVELLAKSLFSHAVNIDHELPITERLNQTEKAINCESPFIFEASFLVDHCFAAADILQKTENGWKLIEIKATNNIDKKHLQDVAFQFYVLIQAGLPIFNVNIMYLNKEAAFHGEIDKDLFLIEDVSHEIEDCIRSIEDHITQAQSLLTMGQEPQGKLCRSCFQDAGCSFKSYCWRNINKPTVFDIPLHWKYRDQFIDSGMLLLEDIPNDMTLKDNVKTSIERGKRKSVDIDQQGIQQWLNQLTFPLYFLDFETYGPAIPLFKGMKPYQRIPFQFSCHILDEYGSLIHQEFLHQENSDPRSFFIESLMQTIGAKGSIVVYHKSFEAGVMQELLEIAAEQQKIKVQNYINRLLDLEDIFKKYYHHYAFKGSTSIKAILPVLCPELSYKELDIQKGDQASIAWLDVITGDHENPTAENLKKYCQLDTYAMVSIYNKLIRELETVYNIE